MAWFGFDNDGINNGDEIGDDDDDGTPDYDEENNGDPAADDNLGIWHYNQMKMVWMTYLWIRGIHQYPNNTLEIFNRWGVKVMKNRRIRTR